MRLYGQARGRGAEYWGENFLNSDKWMWTNGVPARAKRWADEQINPSKSMLESYIVGVNDYAAKHPENISDDFEVVLPITMEDLMAHALRVLQYTFVISPDDLQEDAKSWSDQKGSNAWAVSPSRSVSGHAMLVANPHLYWGDLFTWFEVHLNLPDANIYGASLVGSPALGIMFNEHLGWTHTVNTHDGADLYELTLADGGYDYDGVIRPFAVDSIELHIKEGDSSRTEILVVKRSIHGPVVKEDEKHALALRVAALDASQIFTERWNMALTTNLEEFEASLQDLQTPMFTVMYADKSGNIFTPVWRADSTASGRRL